MVDLPGVRDANVARGAVAEKYMKSCNAVWIVADITRAVDNRTAKVGVVGSLCAVIVGKCATSLHCSLLLRRSKCPPIGDLTSCCLFGLHLKHVMVSSKGSWHA